MMMATVNQVKPAEVNLIVYERNDSNFISATIGVVKKIFRTYNLNVQFISVDENWEEDFHALVKRVVFIVTSDTFISQVKKKISLFREKNNNNPNERNIQILIVMVNSDDEDEDYDSEDDMIFSINDEKENDILKVDKLSNVYEWWPSVLQFLKPKDPSTNSDQQRKYGCFFVFSEDSKKESEWFKRHRDSLENLGISCLRRERGSTITDDLYMKSSRCVAMYVNSKRSTDKIQEFVRKAVENECKIRLYLESARIEFAEAVRDACQLTLSGTTIHAHLASLMKDLEISKFSADH